MNLSSCTLINYIITGLRRGRLYLVVQRLPLSWEAIEYMYNMEASRMERLRQQGLVESCVQVYTNISPVFGLVLVIVSKASLL